MSSTKRMILPSTLSTVDAWVFNTGSPYVRIEYDISARLRECRPSVTGPPGNPTRATTSMTDLTHRRIRSLVDVTLPDTAFVMETDRGVFSRGHLDTATSMLLRADLPIASTGNLLDLGCGAGPIAITMARRSPGATVWAVDVNTRARETVPAQRRPKRPHQPPSCRPR